MMLWWSECVRFEFPGTIKKQYSFHFPLREYFFVCVHSSLCTKTDGIPFLLCGLRGVDDVCVNMCAVVMVMELPQDRLINSRRLPYTHTGRRSFYFRVPSVANESDRDLCNCHTSNRLSTTYHHLKICT